MSNFDETRAAIAIKEAMEQTVKQFGLSFLRTLSFFPSAEQAKASQKEAS